MRTSNKKICLGLVILVFIVFSGCAKDGTNGLNGADGSKGDTGQTGAQGPQGTAGPSGSNGSNGINGSQGYGAGIKVTALSAGATCAAGGIQVENYQDFNNNGQLDSGEPLIGLNYVCNGTNGSNGTNGTNGTNGANGISSTFSVLADSGAHCSNGGFDVTLTDYLHSETDYVCNGNNGANGQNGQAGTNGQNGANGGTVSFSLVQAILPCGYASSPWKEVVLGLQGGQLLSSFSENANGLNTRFAFIPNGSYSDTDSSGCQFTVTGDGSTVSDIGWGAGSNGYSTWAAGGYHWTQATGWVGY